MPKTHFFLKNFNDSNWYSSNTATISSDPMVFPRVVSTSGASYIDGTPALAFNVGIMQVEKAIGFPPLLSDFQKVSLNNMVNSYDAVKVSFQVRGYEVSGQSGGFSVNGAISFPFYCNYAGYSKTYSIICLFPVTISLGANPGLYSVQPDANVQGLAKVSQVYALSTSPFSYFSLSLATTAGTRSYSVIGSTKPLTYTESQLKNGLLTDFCAGSSNPSDCMAKAMGNVSTNGSQGDVNYSQGDLSWTTCSY